MLASLIKIQFGIDPPDQALTYYPNNDLSSPEKHIIEDNDIISKIVPPGGILQLSSKNIIPVL